MTLNGGTDSAAQVYGGTGGAGGNGGSGGSGGSGYENMVTFAGGSGGQGAAATAGGQGGTGGPGQGGDDYVSAGATLNVNGTTFSDNIAFAGVGGTGGGGGRGGSGGNAGGSGGSGPNGVVGAAGGVGGTGGDAEGGAIYNAGTLNITSATFSGNSVGPQASLNGGVGGAGGPGGQGGLGGGTGNGGNGADGAAAGAGGQGGTGAGGAIYNAGTMTLGQATFSSNSAAGGQGGTGGQGGAGGCPNACLNTAAGTGTTYGTNAAGATGGNGGPGSDGSMASVSAISGCTSFSGSSVSGGAAGGGGLGGIGGYDATPPNPTGAPGGPGTAGTSGAADPTVNGSAACPTLSVADASVLEPSGGATATLTFTVTLSAAYSQTVTVAYATADGTALAGTDYDAASGTLTIPAGQTTATIPVTVHDVGFEPDKTFTVTLSNPTPTQVTLSQATATGTIHGRSPLSVAIGVPTDSFVQETASGPVEQVGTITLTVTNTGTQPITDVTLPSQLSFAWAAPASGDSIPVTQTAAPTTLDVGTLAPGASTQAIPYTIDIKGDSSLNVQALVTGGLNGQTIKGLGSQPFQSDSQLLYMSAKLGSYTVSTKHPPLVQAGTSFLVDLTLSNRSYYRTVAIDPIYPNLAGNASGGDLFDPAAVVNDSDDPTGSLDEVDLSPAIVLKPQQTDTYVVLVRTTASDPLDPASTAPGGSTAHISFDTPTIYTVANDVPTQVDSDTYVVMGEGTSDVSTGIDDSGPIRDPFSASDVVWNVAKGITWGLWKTTWGMVRGLVYDLPSLVIKGISKVSSATLDYIDQEVDLYQDCEDDPGCIDAWEQAVEAKVQAAFANAPFLLADSASELKAQIDQSLQAHWTKLLNDWNYGTPEAALNALTDLTSDGTETVANIAMLAGPAVLARFPRAAAAVDAAKTALYSKVSEGLNAAVRALEPVKAAFLALRNVVKPGYWFTPEQMVDLFGVSERETSLLSAFTKRLGISVVLRSRASQAIKFLEEGLAVVKPYWIKTKNVSFIDTEYLGYIGGTGPESELGKVVIRKPLSLSEVEANLTKGGVTPQDPVWSETMSRWKTRVKEYNGEYKQMQKWAKAGKVRGKWPWADNAVNPAVQADEYSTVPFRLVTENGAVIPEIRLPGAPPAGGWKFITGDIDLIAITKADGSALSNADQVAYLKQLKNILGAQHPESATWVNDGKFWFKAKEGYLTNDGECCLAQYGPDGRVRAVEFNQALSDPEAWTPDNYRIFWNGGYQGP